MKTLSRLSRVFLDLSGNALQSALQNLNLFGLACVAGAERGGGGRKARKQGKGKGAPYSSPPYSGVIFRGVISTPKRSLKNSFLGVKVTPDIEELK